MLYVQVWVNDEDPMVWLAVQNTGPLADPAPGEEGIRVYWVRGVDRVDGRLVESDVIFDVYHDRADGASALAAKVLAEFSARMRDMGFDV